MKNAIEMLYLSKFDMLPMSLQIVSKSVNTIAFGTCPFFSPVCLLASPKPPKINSRKATHFGAIVRDMTLICSSVKCQYVSMGVVGTIWVLVVSTIAGLIYLQWSNVFCYLACLQFTVYLLVLVWEHISMLSTVLLGLNFLNCNAI